MFTDVLCGFPSLDLIAKSITVNRVPSTSITRDVKRVMKDELFMSDEEI
jgi:hypothetical protein